MTVYEWVMSKDSVTVDFDKSNDGAEILAIRMYISISPHGTIAIKNLFMNDRIPPNDDFMIVVLDQMYQDLINLYNNTY